MSTSRLRALLKQVHGLPARTRSGSPRLPRGKVARWTSRPSLEALEDRLVPTTFLVANLNDAGAGSLRQAILDANANPGADVINFQLGLSGTLTLTSGELAVTDAVTINGPGASALTVSGNNASRLFNLDTPGAAFNVAINALTLTRGAAAASSVGGAITSRENLTLSDVVITNCLAAGGGGIATLAGSTTTLTHCSLTGNTATSLAGGGLLNSGTATLTDCTLTGNSASGGGGGIVNAANATVNLLHTTLVNNAAGAFGGGLLVSGTATRTDCTLRGNSAGTGGGGIATTGGATVNFRHSTLTGNSALVGGGLANVATANLSDCTLQSHSAAGTGVDGAAGQGVPAGQSFGVGLVNFFMVTLTNCTVADNVATVPGGCTFLNDGVDTVDPGSGTLTLNNTIVAGSSAKIVNVNGGVVKGSHNLIQGESPAGLTGTLTVNPLLAPLGSYGGPTPTRALLPGSPALGAGDPTLAVDRIGQPLTTDQRGQPRLNSGTVDLGAFESRGFTLTRSGGDNQSTVINTAFAQPLQVTVTAKDPGVPVAGGVLTFSTPTSGASATLGATSVSVPASGVVSVTATANNTFGRYNVTASAGANNTTAFTLTNQLVLSASGVNFNATAGAPFNGTVATFIDSGSFGAAAYTAIIRWGDGSALAGIISGSGSTLTVTGSYTYADPSNKTVHVTISHNLGYTTTATTTTTATVTGLGQGVVKGLTAGIGFWHNKQGQALINSFNGGSTSTALANWLAATFPNLYGATAGVNNLTGKTNAQVAAYFQTLFSLGGTQVQAEVLAAALNVYATTSSLGGSAGVAYGFTVSPTGLGARSYNVGKDGAAFGVPNNSTLNVYQLLLAVNNKATKGVLYNGDAALQAQAADLFDVLNNAGGIG